MLEDKDLLSIQEVRSKVDKAYAAWQKYRGYSQEQVDAIVAPVSPFPAFKLGEKVDDPLAMYLSDIYTITGSLAGIPCMSVPCGNTSDGLPVICAISPVNPPGCVA